MIEISYRNKRLEREAEDISRLRTSYGNWVPPNLIVQRLSQISAAKSLQDLKQLPQLYFHGLEGKRKGCFAIDIKPRGKYRIVLKPQNGERKDLRTITRVMIMELCIDYH